MTGVAQTVSVTALKPNAYNPNAMDPVMYRKELASIRKFGFVDPITVRILAGGMFEIIDGEHRWRAAKELGLTEVPIFNLGKVSDAEAKQLTIVLNETRGKSNPRKLGDVLRDLLSSEPKSDLLDLLPYSPPVFDRLTGDLELEAWEAPEMSKASWVERTYRLSADAAKVIDEAISRVREEEESILDWQALELICADYLSGK